MTVYNLLQMSLMCALQQGIISDEQARIASRWIDVQEAINDVPHTR
jgi:hypothetical protein